MSHTAGCWVSGRALRDLRLTGSRLLERRRGSVDCCCARGSMGMVGSWCVLDCSSQMPMKSAHRHGVGIAVCRGPGEHDAGERGYPKVSVYRGWDRWQSFEVVGEPPFRLGAGMKIGLGRIASRWTSACKPRNKLYNHSGSDT